jgi:ribonuclease PH
MPRSHNRTAAETRPVSFQPDIAPHAHGSVLVSFGNTRVICSAMIEEGVPRWMKEQGVTGGWLTAEYSMLPYSTLGRKPRDSSRGKLDGRGVEIQRLIGRALRAAVDLEALGPRTLWVDCDVLQADGGTRTAAISGACVAVVLAGRKLIDQGKLAKIPLRQMVAAVSLGLVGGEILLDLDYLEDKDAAVDLNLVMTESLDLVELQASGEEAVFSEAQLQALLELGKSGIGQILRAQQSALLPLPSA